MQVIQVQNRLLGMGNLLGFLHDGGRHFRGGVQQGGGMALGGHQHMAWVDLADVHEGDGRRIFVNADSGNFASHQATEDALAGRGGINKHGHGGTPGNGRERVPVPTGAARGWVEHDGVCPKAYTMQQSGPYAASILRDGAAGLSSSALPKAHHDPYH
jgi:hypothetical protein